MPCRQREKGVEKKFYTWERANGEVDVGGGDGLGRCVSHTFANFARMAPHGFSVNSNYVCVKIEAGHEF